MLFTFLKSSQLITLLRVQHRLCPSRFPLLFFASSRHPAQRNVSIPIPPDCICQHAIDVNVTGRLALKWIENTLFCFRSKGNIPEMRTWNPQWNAEGQNRTTTWKTSARGFSSLGLFVWRKWYIMLRNHLLTLGRPHRWNHSARKIFIYHEPGFDIWFSDFVCHPDHVCGWLTTNWYACISKWNVQFKVRSLVVLVWVLVLVLLQKGRQIFANCNCR